ncbi:spore maturation protein B [Anaerobranca californiensis DSM 14826]|jgi:spore maturation protein B|uniref:Spore maturation protein B n=1 Tax=Anaerobranca californiensis DSM 14826 TaxID=1120989 RepID=A0A1M6L0U5_9FIRM|nr:spore maturation protein [Anaerobranca californiensis]SHJ64828.1 spore maturation protein B [Anaerobranca californiensis DSM 14826]
MGIINIVSQWTLPVMVLLVVVYAFIKGVDVFDTFVEGAKEGFQTAVKLIPYLVGMLVAIGIFRESGAFGILTRIIAPITNLLKIPSEILPLALMRPISGSGALAMATEIMEHYGPDSYLGMIASTLQGSTDTTLYILTVYFGSVGIKKIRYSMTVGLLADMAGFLASILVCRVLL